MSHQQLFIILALLTPEEIETALELERRRAKDEEVSSYERALAHQNIVALMVERELRGAER